MLFSVALSIFDIAFSKSLAKRCNAYTDEMISAVYSGDSLKYSKSLTRLKEEWQKAKRIMRFFKNENKVEEITEIIEALEDFGEPSLEKLRLIDVKLNEI